MAELQSQGTVTPQGTQGEVDVSETAHNPLAPNVRAPLEALLKTLSQLIQQVKAQKETVFELGPGAPLVPPIPEFQQAARLVSDGCTKLTVLFSSRPLPSSADCAALTSRLEQTASHLLATYHHISPTYGVVLHQEVQRCALSVLRGVESLISSIMATGSSTVQHGLRATGSVWEYCDRATKVSRDNKVAAVRELLSQLQLIRDGNREAQEVATERGKWRGGCGGDVGEICEGVRGVQLEGESGGPREWTEREKQLAEPCIHLVKLCSEMTSELCRLVVTNGECSVKDAKVWELDNTVAMVLELSPLVDELAGELPAPLLWPDCTEAGERLAAAITHLLHTVSSFHFCRSAGEKWSELQQKYSTSLTPLTHQITATTSGT